MRNEERFNMSLGLAAGILALSGIGFLAGLPATSEADAAASTEPRQAVERAFQVVEESGVLQLERPRAPVSDGLVIQGQSVENHASLIAGGNASGRSEQPSAAVLEDERGEIRAAVSVFVWGLSNGVANAVWALAPEMEQDRLGTQQAVLEHFSEGNPPVRHAARMVFDSVAWQDGLPVAEVYIVDRLGLQWRAAFGLYRNNVGEWKIISSEIEPAPGELI